MQSDRPNHSGFEWVHVEISGKNRSLVARFLLSFANDLGQGRAFKTLARIAPVKLAWQVNSCEENF